MDRGTLAVAVVHHEIVLVQLTRLHTSRERTVDVIIYRQFGGRTFFADPSRPRARIAAYDLLCILPSDNAKRCPLTGMLELPKAAYREYVEIVTRHQKRVAHMWGAAIPFRISLR